MQFEQAGEFILKKLQNELPAGLTYHNVGHVKDVYAAAENLCKLESVSAHETQLVLTAALFHDSGFTLLRKGHEEESCQIARQILPDFEYSPEDIETICGIIMATHIPQSPKTHLEEIMADADLDYLGRDDFFPIAQNLYTELFNSGGISSMEQWDKIQLQFMNDHHFFTKSALNLRQAKKLDNIEWVKTRLASY